jgi:hypothetical protein
LASALVELGEFLEADDLIDEVLNDESAPQDLQRRVMGLRETIARRAGELSVAVSGFPTGVSVSVDGREVSSTRLAGAFPLSPGSHVVTAIRDGQEVAREEVRIRRGQSSEVTLEVAPRAVDTAEQSVEQDDSHLEETDEGGSVLGEWWFWTAVGAVVVGTAVVLLLTVDGGVEDPVEGDFSPTFLRF